MKLPGHQKRERRRKRRNCTNCDGAGYFILYGLKMTCPSCHPSGRVNAMPPEWTPE